MTLIWNWKSVQISSSSVKKDTFSIQHLLRIAQEDRVAKQKWRPNREKLCKNCPKRVFVGGLDIRATFSNMFRQFVMVLFLWTVLWFARCDSKYCGSAALSEIYQCYCCLNVYIFKPILEEKKKWEEERRRRIKEKKKKGEEQEGEE